MTLPLWRLSATELARLIRRKEVSCREATQSVLDRIAEANPRVNALPEVLATQAIAAAEAADRALASGAAPGLLHGVPVTTKINVDQAGCATTNGIVALKDLVAETDAPVVANLKRAGAVIVGRSNTPSFSLRWFTDNDLHGRTLNPWDPKLTPGGSSGGAGVATALGMGAIAHGNDYGGSVRYPAYACGVVGLRPSAGRVPAYNPTMKEERGIAPQLMAVQGPLTRSVADARLALEAMAQEDARDPNWVPAPLAFPDEGGKPRVALFRRHPAYDPDPAVVDALDRAARWLAASGWAVEEVEPPQFEAAAALWRQMVYDDVRRSMLPAIDRIADAATRESVHFIVDQLRPTDRDGYLELTARRLGIAREWSLFFKDYPVLLLPVSWQKPFPNDDDRRSPERMNEIVAAQSPMLGTAMLGLPGLSVPTHLTGDGLPMGVQLVSWRFREDLCLRAGEIIEKAAGFSALDTLASR
jgi:amidase